MRLWLDQDMTCSSFVAELGIWRFTILLSSLLLGKKSFNDPVSTHRLIGDALLWGSRYSTPATSSANGRNAAPAETDSAYSAQNGLLRCPSWGGMLCLIDRYGSRKNRKPQWNYGNSENCRCLFSWNSRKRRSIMDRLPSCIDGAYCRILEWSAEESNRLPGPSIQLRCREKTASEAGHLIGIRYLEKYY